MPGTLDCLFGLSLALGAVAAALPRVYLAAIRQKFLQRLNVLVVNVFYASSAKPARRLLTSSCNN